MQTGVSLAPLTTLGVGGPAARFEAPSSEEALLEALRAASGAGPDELLLLGGGSNLLVGDAGFPGLVLALRHRGVRASGRDPVLVEVAAGEPWDDIVAWTVERGLAGLECLSGIPGRAGATPIRNVGAYGQEVGDALVDLRAWDRRDQRVVTLRARDCALGYRSSAFAGAWAHRYCILSLRFALRPGAPGAPRQGELARRLAALERSPTLADLRAIVLELRRAKGMVYDPAEADSHSAGSFFVNPVVSLERADRIEAAVGAAQPMPRYPAGDRGVKLAAAWLIERAGFPRGYRLGRAGLSSRHSLAIVNRGGASAHEVAALARRVRAGVHERFGVRLQPEPVLVGVSLDVSEDQGPSSSG
jgi:UDP-N-acetylmuramate dehydrogenase